MGCCIDTYVILAANIWATKGTMVADKQCQKLHQLAQSSWCCGAGTSAGLDHLTKHCLYSMALQQLQHNTVGNEGSMDLLCGPQMDQEDDDESLYCLVIGSVLMDALCHFYGGKFAQMINNQGRGLYFLIHLFGNLFDFQRWELGTNHERRLDSFVRLVDVVSNLTGVFLLQRGKSKLRGLQLL
jgi:hypothetical protein